MQITAKITGLQAIKRALKAESERQDKALETAIKVEGFRLRKKLMADIRRGSPGGRKFKKLTYLSRAWGGKGRLGPDRPLRRLALAVRYLIKTNPFEMKIGWVGDKTSKSWKRIARMQQEGFDHDVTPERRAYFASVGGRIGKRSLAKKYLFLRKSTTRFKTPARPIIDPFWAAEEQAAMRNIRRNYLTALQGKVIRSGYGSTVRQIKGK